MLTKASLNEMFDYPAWSAVKFCESPLCTIYAKRTWKARLLSWPWQPWRRYGKVPDPQIYEIERGVFVGHPVTIAAVRKAVMRGN